jgi:hypothetical protein
MTLAALFERVGAAAKSQLEQQPQGLSGVYDDQLWTILGELNLLADLDAGKLCCHFSGVPLTRDNIAGLVNTADGPRLVALTGMVGAALSR